MLSDIAPAELNWSGNYRYGFARLHQPESVAELREVLAREPAVRVLGSRHSFNGIADGEAAVSLARLPSAFAVARDRTTATVSGQLTYGDLVARLGRERLALGNLPSLPHVSVAGAIATGSHGSGLGNGSMAAAVAGLRLITPGGEAGSRSDAARRRMSSPRRPWRSRSATRLSAPTRPTPPTNSASRAAGPNGCHIFGSGTRPATARRSSPSSTCR